MAEPIPVQMDVLSGPGNGDPWKDAKRMTRTVLQVKDFVGEIQLQGTINREDWVNIQSTITGCIVMVVPGYWYWLRIQTISMTGAAPVTWILGEKTFK